MALSAGFGFEQSPVLWARPLAIQEIVSVARASQRLITVVPET
jgi:hypothetical protein